MNANDESIDDETLSYLVFQTSTNQQDRSFHPNSPQATAQSLEASSSLNERHLMRTKEVSFKPKKTLQFFQTEYTVNKSDNRHHLSLPEQLSKYIPSRTNGTLSAEEAGEDMIGEDRWWDSAVERTKQALSRGG